MNLKDVKDPIEIRPPGSDRDFILLRVEKARDRIWFVRFDDGPLDLRHGSVVESVVNKPGTVSGSASFKLTLLIAQSPRIRAGLTDPLVCCSVPSQGTYRHRRSTAPTRRNPFC